MLVRTFLKQQIEFTYKYSFCVCEGFDDMSRDRRQLNKGIRYCNLEEIIDCQDPSYRICGSVSRNLDNSEIILALCDRETRSNYSFSCKNIMKTSEMMNVGTCALVYKIQAKLPGRFVQANRKTTSGEFNQLQVYPSLPTTKTVDRSNA